MSISIPYYNKHMKHIPKLELSRRLRIALAVGAGFLLGVLVVFGIRFATYSPPEHNHYHANFAVFINGEREEFKQPKYYEEVAICSTGTGITMPQQRAHMHDNVNAVVHVHDHATTWGQFFENLGWNIGPDFIQTADGTLYKEDDTNKLHLVINDQDYTGITNLTNMVIEDRSRVLISFGEQNKESLDEQFDTVANNALRYNETTDPASCSSGHETGSFGDRLRSVL